MIKLFGRYPVNRLKPFHLKNQGVCTVLLGLAMSAESAMTVIVSTGIGVSVVAGILSGICYIVAYSLKPKTRYRKPVPPWKCKVCEHQLPKLNDGFLDNLKVIRCGDCKNKVCRETCAKFDHVTNQWLCVPCENSWLKGLFTRFAKSSLFASVADDRRYEDIEEELMEKDKRRVEKEYIRDFIERLVASLIGSNVDDACINKLYKDKEYLALFDRYYTDLCNALNDLGSALHISLTNLPALGQSPCNAHANLKQIIEKLLKETLQISDISRLEEQPASLEEDRVQSYEELLATAILNKVVDYQAKQQQTPPSSSTTSSRKRIKSHKHHPEKQYFFADQTLEDKYQNGEFETSSTSSLCEEPLFSDSSHGSTKYVDRFSLTIQQHIEATNNSSGNEEEEDFEHVRPNSARLEESSNWYLQKRHRFSSNSPVPVPMLVPNPMGESKVLIGDKGLDETSDLSDTASDFGDDRSTSASGINSLIVESKTVIGGKNVLNQIISVEEFSDIGSSIDSGVKTDKMHVESRTDISMDDDNVEDTSIDSQHSNVEKDAEYAEKYESLPRTVEVKRTLRSTTSLPEKNNQMYDSDSDDIDGELNLRFQGNYSKREMEKWKHPIQMINNPYTKENIEKRRKNSFGRDYYTKLASKPTGSTKSKNDLSWLANQQETTEDENDQGYIHTAIPVQTHNSSDEFTDTNPTDPLPEHADDHRITSDSDMSLINCYDVESSTVLRRPSAETPPIELLSIKKIPEANNNPPRPKARTFHGLVTKMAENSLRKSDEVEMHDKPKAPLRQQDTHLKRKIAAKESNEVPILKRSSSLHDIVTAAMADARPELVRSKSGSALDELQNGNRPFALGKKFDNTLIRKIYANQSVRNYALSHRPVIPVESGPKVETKLNGFEGEEMGLHTIRDGMIIKPPEQFASSTPIQKAIRAFERIENDSNNNVDKFHSLHSRHEDDIDINEESLDINFESLPIDEKNGEELIARPSVAELRKKFDAMSSSNNNNKPIHSLTARKKRVYNPLTNGNLKD